NRVLRQGQREVGACLAVARLDVTELDVQDPKRSLVLGEQTRDERAFVRGENGVGLGCIVAHYGSNGGGHVSLEVISVQFGRRAPDQLVGARAIDAVFLPAKPLANLPEQRRHEAHRVVARGREILYLMKLAEIAPKEAAREIFNLAFIGLL